jgi:hypothetical protein
MTKRKPQPHATAAHRAAQAVAQDGDAEPGQQDAVAAPAPESATAPAPVAVARPASRWSSIADDVLALSPVIATSLVVSLVIMALALWVYDKRRAQVFAVVDLPGIVELEQLRLTVSAVAPGLNEAGRQSLLADAQAFGDRLSKEIEALRSQCGCVLLTSASFVGEPPADYTATLKSRLGLDKLNAEALRKQAQSRLEAAIPALGQASPGFNQPERSAGAPMPSAPSFGPQVRP